jgi:hypothetical protein
MNIALKVAIAQRGMTSREVSLRTHITEARMTALIHRRGPAPTKREKTKLARVLKVDREILFASEPIAELAS